MSSLLLVISATTVFAKDCPPWFKWTNTSSSGYCVCASEITGAIECDQTKQESSLRRASCVFYDSEIYDVVVGGCPFLFPKNIGFTFPLLSNLSLLNITVCGNLSQELKGPLCGKCTGNTGISVYSIGSQCVPCNPVNIVYYLLLQYLPITLMFLVTLFLRLNITVAPMFFSATLYMIYGILLQVSHDILH